MKARAGNFVLGLFVLAGIGLAIAATLVIGAGEFGVTGTSMETYLDESVQGLDIGAPVKMRGVEIGRVSEIGFVGRYYPLEAGSDDFYRFGRYVLVRAELTDELIPANESTFFANDLRRLVQQEGLRAMVAALGLTGTSYLELDYLDPKRNPALDVPWTPRVVYVPSAQSTFNRLGTAAERVFQRLNQLQIENLISDFDVALIAFTRAVTEADVGAVSQESTKLLADVRATSASLRRAIEQADVPRLQKNVDDVMNRLAGTVERLELVVTSQSGNLDAIMSELRETTRHLRELSEAARSHPSSFLFSDPPKPVVLPRREEAR